ncbi:hypothetical protein [Actinoplanes sp. NPDC049681]|uniref:hypothetical protein n=1 Tax=Actinoplanes sp. NPDC049681 TaxID=3363905 RepID=UPI003791FDDD
MINDPREPADRRPRTETAGAGPATIDIPQATDSVLIDLISQGSVPAFVALFDRTSEAVHTELTVELTGTSRTGEIFAASYAEVWWLAGHHRTLEADAIGWIISIVRRRIAEASRETVRPGARTVLEGLRPSYAELEVAALLNRPVDCLRQP